MYVVEMIKLILCLCFIPASHGNAVSRIYEDADSAKRIGARLIARFMAGAFYGKGTQLNAPMQLTGAT